MNTQDAKRVLETALICAQQPLAVANLHALFEDQVGIDTIKNLLGELVDDWSTRGVELVPLASGWRFQSRPEMREYLNRLNPEKPPRYSRAVLETLAIVAYRQPVTRARISAVRGVNVDGVVRTLTARGLVADAGQDLDSAATLYRTTPLFLERLGLRSLEELPALAPLLPELDELDDASSMT